MPRRHDPTACDVSSDPRHPVLETVPPHGRTGGPIDATDGPERVAADQLTSGPSDPRLTRTACGRRTDPACASWTPTSPAATCSRMRARCCARRSASACLRSMPRRRQSRWPLNSDRIAGRRHSPPAPLIGGTKCRLARWATGAPLEVGRTADSDVHSDVFALLGRALAACALIEMTRRGDPLPDMAPGTSAETAAFLLGLSRDDGADHGGPPASRRHRARRPTAHGLPRKSLAVSRSIAQEFRPTTPPPDVARAIAIVRAQMVAPPRH
jgi:hypothetical protein